MGILVGLLVTVVEFASRTLSLACVAFVFDEAEMPEDLIR